MQKTHDSYWMRTSTPPLFPENCQPSHWDVAIVGAGLTGISLAALLVEAGAKVVVLEADRVGGGTTGKTTAKITIQHRLKYHQLIKQMGLENAQRYAMANRMGLEQIATFIHSQHIDCDFKQIASCVYGETEDDLALIDDEFFAMQQLGIPVHPIDKNVFPFPVTSGIVLDNQAQFHPLSYLYALAKKVDEAPNGAIYEQSMVTGVEKGSPCTVHTPQATMTADTVVLATNYPIKDMPGLYFTRLHQNRSYILSVAPEDFFFNTIAINAQGPVNSIRMHTANNQPQLLVGGYGHKTGKNENNQSGFDYLHDFVSKKLKVRSQPQAPIYQWATQDCLSLDGVPYMGTLSPKTPNILIATGYGKWGMTNATAAALILANYIQSTAHPILDTAELFSPRRFTLAASAKSFFVQGLETAEAFTLGNVDIPAGSFDDVGPEEAKILKIDGQVMAIYRNKDGIVSAFNPHCTHMGCPLTVNEEEMSWDCSCHGSRFDMEGHVIEGPATQPLKRIQP
jgi:glycine/D-amino acid oxidase-like deaminating enzyme/nitrite reductase/ring-hydroxylating ferredoxin subunit